MRMKFQIGMKLSLGVVGEVGSSIVQLTKESNGGFSYHNLVSGLDGWASYQHLNQVAELVG